MTQPGDVVITAKEVYDKLSTLDSKVDKLNERFSNVQEKIRDHENRIRALEFRVWMAMGGGTVLGAAAGAIVSKMTGA
ncbi:hypothetical protein [Amycolatopsis taiwanensis]|uniref:hypothetical protein n=1 Tax=Amycolatopsis taiwanensis TaxID=342230 RepID=UPI00048348F5|nr:hypothetical protein [Amycolatopsis taiwanensis]